ncbi:hypothetical protein V6N13_083468 [Hibiscus sabdariffa]
MSRRVDNSRVSSWKLLAKSGVRMSSHILLPLEQSSIKALILSKTMYISSKQRRVEGDKKIETGSRRSSSNKIARSLDLFMEERDFRNRRH